MSEYELHQLAIVSRFEFDVATLVYMAWAAAFLFLCRDRTERWSRKAGWSVAALYTFGCGILLVRCIAAMVRYGKELALLRSFDSLAILSNPGGLWLTTLIVRYTFLALATVVPLYFIFLKSRGPRP